MRIPRFTLPMRIDTNLSWPSCFVKIHIGKSSGIILLIVCVFLKSAVKAEKVVIEINYLCLHL